MICADQEVLVAACAWLQQKQRVALVTVARTYGSSPRPAGSLLAVNANGNWAGAVSGGCVESHLAVRLRDAWPAQPQLISLGTTKEDAAQLGLPCGGQVEILVESVESAVPLHTLLHAIAARKLLARRVCLATGEVSLHAVSRTHEFFFDNQNLEKVFGPQWRVLLIGAGQLSRFVAQMALALDYEVVVCEPRAEYARQWDVAGARLDNNMPDEAAAAARDARSAVLALTHDPELDDLALSVALPSDAFYVGALGSMTNNTARRKRLAWLGLDEQAIARLHGPVGLPIGSKTPAEIALSILAGLTAVRRGAELRLL
ncbi:MAG: XdhC family protein [Gammaproteobacteria bacterium]|nr:XdhC family protein [Gammaproteobacteria bacterium]